MSSKGGNSKGSLEALLVIQDLEEIGLAPPVVLLVAVEVMLNRKENN